jgi:hypothetical protein
VGGSELASSYAAMAEDAGEGELEPTTNDSASNDNARDDGYEISSEYENGGDGGDYYLEYVPPPDDATMEEDATKSVDKQQGRTKAAAKSIKRVVGSTLPKVEILPWTTFVCLFLWCTIP